jgi:hypothetical protein
MPLRERYFLHLAGAIGPGVGDENVEPPEAFANGGDRAGPCGFVADVELHISSLVTKRGNDVLRLIRFGKIGDHHRRALGKEALCGGVSDALQSAGDKGDAAFEAVHTPIIPAVDAPSIEYSLPDMKAASSLARKATSAATSST